MKILASDARIPYFGIGVFTTKMKPHETNNRLLENNYTGNTKYEDRLEVAFAIKPNRSVQFSIINDKWYPNRDLWKCEVDIDLKKCDFLIVIRE